MYYFCNCNFFHYTTQAPEPLPFYLLITLCNFLPSPPPSHQVQAHITLCQTHCHPHSPLWPLCPQSWYPPRLCCTAQLSGSQHSTPPSSCLSLAQNFSLAPTTYKIRSKDTGTGCCPVFPPTHSPFLKQISFSSLRFSKPLPTWKIPWTEEPGGLQSMGSLRVGHDWATSLSLSYLKAFAHASPFPIPQFSLSHPSPLWFLSLTGYQAGDRWVPGYKLVSYLHFMGHEEVGFRLDTYDCNISWD